MKKAIIEWLETIEDDTIRKQALDNAIPEALDLPVDSLSQAIMKSCTWSYTPQGMGYWNNIYDKAFNGDLKTRESETDAAFDPTITKQTAESIDAEIARAKSKHPGDFNSIHEGYAVLIEEVDELWDEIKRSTPDKQRIREEAVQVAAMAIRIINELTK